MPYGAGVHIFFFPAVHNTCKSVIASGHLHIFTYVPCNGTVLCVYSGMLWSCVLDHFLHRTFSYNYNTESDKITCTMLYKLNTAKIDIKEVTGLP